MKLVSKRRFRFTFLHFCLVELFAGKFIQTCEEFPGKNIQQKYYFTSANLSPTFYMCALALASSSVCPSQTILSEYGQKKIREFALRHTWREKETNSDCYLYPFTNSACQWFKKINIEHTIQNGLGSKWRQCCRFDSVIFQKINFEKIWWYWLEFVTFTVVTWTLKKKHFIIRWPRPQITNRLISFLM